MPSTGSSILSLTLLVSGYLNSLCLTSPNKATTFYSTDRIRFLTNTPSILGTHTSSLATLYHALVTLFSTSSLADREIISRICLYPEHLDSKSVTWTPRTVG
ncbi:hypothetical protein BDW59DRAFT_31053 [Aspergillus cavernicola]|uniref:Secreted protein n=1 Tax=Aspergillus cavernicola TaxID=176166 RepID=A0ABR4HDJ3_9EURO